MCVHSQVTALLEDSAMRLYRAHSEDVAAVFEISLDVHEEYDGHQWGRPFWFRAKIPGDAPQQQQERQQQGGVSPGSEQQLSTTYDLKVLDWRCVHRLKTWIKLSFQGHGTWPYYLAIYQLVV